MPFGAKQVGQPVVAPRSIQSSRVASFALYLLAITDPEAALLALAAGELEIVEMCRRGLRGDDVQGTTSEEFLSRHSPAAIGLLFLLPLFQHIVQGCNQLQQFFWIVFATGSLAELPPVLILEVALIFDVQNVVLLSTSSPANRNS